MAVQAHRTHRVEDSISVELLMPVPWVVLMRCRGCFTDLNDFYPGTSWLQKDRNSFCLDEGMRRLAAVRSVSIIEMAEICYSVPDYLRSRDRMF